ncbi:MAG: hypothetical protein ACLFR7_09695 [Opitutales bacterium]
MHKALPFLFLALCLLAVSGCETTSSRGTNLPTDWVSFTGTVEWVPKNRGFWGIRSEQFGRLNTLRLPEDMKQNGLRVRGEVLLKPQVHSARDWGTVAEVRNLETLD